MARLNENTLGAARNRQHQDSMTAKKMPAPQNLTEVIDLLQANGEDGIARNLYLISSDITRDIGFERGRIKFCPLDTSPADLGGRLCRSLMKLTGHNWIVEVTANARWRITEDKSDCKQDDPQIKAFYSSYEWSWVRYDALKRNDGRCELCGRSKHDGVKLNVDHIKPLRKHWALRATAGNLQVLCADCNKGKGNRDETDWRKP